MLDKKNSPNFELQLQKNGRLNTTFKHLKGDTKSPERLVRNTYLSQLLNLESKSRDITCPHTLVILYLTFSPVGGKLSFHSFTLQAPFEPFRKLQLFLKYKV